MEYNTALQYYRWLPLRLIVRNDYHAKGAKRYIINDTKQNIWIPNKHLEEDGTIKPYSDLDYIALSPATIHKASIAGLRLLFIQENQIGGNHE